MIPRIDPADQDLIDRCLTAARSSPLLDRDLGSLLVKRLAAASRHFDIYNSDWPGLGRTVNMVSAIPLDDVIQGVREDFEDVAAPTAEELVEAFRSRWSQIFYDGSGFFARELRASDGQTAWVVLSPVDRGGHDFHGIFPTPLAAEEHYRAEGWVFSQDPEGYPPTPDQPVDDVPSGRWDGYTDDQVLNLVLGLTR